LFEQRINVVGFGSPLRYQEKKRNLLCGSSAKEKKPELLLNAKFLLPLR